MSEILGIVLPYFGLLLLGYGAGRLGRIPAHGISGLNFFVHYLALPALFFQFMAATPIVDMASWTFIATTTFSTYCAFSIAFSLGALINGGNVPEATAQGLVGSYANIGYMAPALTIAAFGAVAGAPTALIFCFDMAMLVILTPLMMALGGTERWQPANIAKAIARQVGLHPFVIATAAGFAVSALRFAPPAPVDNFLNLLAAAAPPAALFLVGVSLSLRPIGKITPTLGALVAIKLAVHPLIVYLLLSWVGGFDRMWVNTAVLVAALPAAANVALIGRRYDTYAAGAATAIVVSTALSAATVTVFLILLLNDLLPTDPFV